MRVPEGGTIVDVGSLLGMSSIFWCQSKAARIVCIDVWNWPWWLRPIMETNSRAFMKANGEVTREAFLAHIKDPRVEAIRGHSPQCVYWGNSPVDLWWEDSDHSNPGLARNVAFWSQHVKRGGIACGHDLHLPDVAAESAALAKKWGAPLNRAGGAVWWILKPAA